MQNELAEISVCSETERGALGKSCRFSGQEKKSRKSHDQLFMKSYMICLSVAQSNYVNIVSNCKVLRDLGERGSEGVFALGKKKKKGSESFFFPFPEANLI